MNYFLNKHQINNINYALTVGGKLLFLCQEFENACKFVISLMITEEKMRKEEKLNFDEFINLYKKNINLPLGRLKFESEDLWKKFYNEDTYLDVQSAIESRNFICHNFFEHMMSEIQVNPHFSVLTFIKNYNTEALVKHIEQGQPRRQKIKYKISENVILEHAKKLALGNYIIVSIQYEIEEKEPFYITKNDYVEAYLQFVQNK